MDTDSDTLGDLGLPPALMAAPREFDAWSKQQLLVEQDESTPVEPLYHYTGEASLRGILSSQKLWCFSHLATMPLRNTSQASPRFPYLIAEHTAGSRKDVWRRP